MILIIAVPKIPPKPLNSLQSLSIPFTNLQLHLITHTHELCQVSPPSYKYAPSSLLTSLFKQRKSIQNLNGKISPQVPLFPCPQIWSFPVFSNSTNDQHSCKNPWQFPLLCSLCHYDQVMLAVTTHYICHQLSTFYRVCCPKLSFVYHLDYELLTTLPVGSSETVINLSFVQNNSMSTYHSAE